MIEKKDKVLEEIQLWMDNVGSYRKTTKDERKCLDYLIDWTNKNKMWESSIYNIKFKEMIYHFHATMYREMKIKKIMKKI